MAGKIFGAIKDIVSRAKPKQTQQIKQEPAQPEQKQKPQIKAANSLSTPDRPLRTQNSTFKEKKYNLLEPEGKKQEPLFQYDKEEHQEKQAEDTNNLISHGWGVTHPGEVLDTVLGVNEAIEKANQKANPYTVLNENTNPDSTQVYENYFSTLSMEDDAKKPEGKDYFSSSPDDALVYNLDGSVSVRDDFNSDFNDAMATYYKQTGVDDGRTTDGRTSNYMTGAQYKTYANLGLGGRPIDEIDDNTVYSKSDEFENYGFQPYIPDREAALKMSREDVAAGPTKIVNELANVREDMTDYTIDGISGKAFDKAARKYFDQSTQQIQDQNRWIYNGSPEFDQIDPNDPNVLSIVNDEWEISFDDGTSRKIRGDYEPYGQEDGSILVQFTDGSEILFEDENDYRTNMRPLEGRPSEEGEEPSLYIPIDPMVINDQEIPYSKAIEYVNGGGERDYGDFGLGKPRAQLQEEGGLLNFSNIAPNFIDLVAGSAPLFAWATSIPTGLSTGEVATHGIDTNTMRADGSSTLLAEDLDNDQYLSNIGASLFMPVTEHFAGNIGGGNILRALPKKFDGKVYQPLAEFLTGVGGEALEEVGPGNITEAIQRQGIKNMFADELTDEEGNVIRDATGHPLYADTDFFGRVGNFGEAAPEAAVGGALLGGAFDVPRLPGYISRANQIRKDNKNGIPARRELKNVPTLTDDMIDYMFERER